MKYTGDQLKKVYGKTNGYCHVCHGKLLFKNYGKKGGKNAWHIDHSRAQAKGGTFHTNNLFPAHWDCNIKKGVKTSRTARSWSGNSRAPYSKEKLIRIRSERRAGGAAIGAAAGIPFGIPGIIIGAAGGALIGELTSPEK